MEWWLKVLTLYSCGWFPWQPASNLGFPENFSKITNITKDTFIALITGNSKVFRSSEPRRSLRPNLYIYYKSQYHRAAAGQLVTNRWGRKYLQLTYSNCGILTSLLSGLWYLDFHYCLASYIWFRSWCSHQTSVLYKSSQSVSFPFKVASLFLLCATKDIW